MSRITTTIPATIAAEFTPASGSAVGAGAGLGEAMPVGVCVIVLGAVVADASYVTPVTPPDTAGDVTSVLALSTVMKQLSPVQLVADELAALVFNAV
jgi:hypothetical protein